jgi:hypothetical protein
MAGVSPYYVCYMQSQTGTDIDSASREASSRMVFSFVLPKTNTLSLFLRTRFSSYTIRVIRVISNIGSVKYLSHF